MFVFIILLGVPTTALKALQSLAKHPELASTLLAAVSVSLCHLYHYVIVTPPLVATTSSPITTQHLATGEWHSSTGGHDMLEGKGMQGVL